MENIKFCQNCGAKIDKNDFDYITFRDSNGFHLKLYKSIEDYKSQKSLNQVMRQQNLIGVFECSGNLKGKNVILYLFSTAFPDDNTNLSLYIQRGRYSSISMYILLKNFLVIFASFI